MKFPARIVFAFFLLLFSSGLLTPFAHAQTSPISTLMRTDNNAPVNITMLTQGIFFGLISSATCIVGGVDYMSPTHKCLTYNPKKGTFGYADTIGGGILGMEAQGITMLYTSPFHTADYVQYMASNFGVVKKVDASNGFSQLAATTKLWLAFRNIAYLLFVIIFVVIGFAIMVRAKIDPRTVMTIENQIPKLVIALILISFSFAIAGLAIDFMWVSVYFIINLFASLDPELAKQVGSMTSHVSDNSIGWVNTLNTGRGGFLGLAGQAAGGVKEIANVIAFGIFQQAGFLKILVTTIFGFPILIGCVLTNFLHISIGPLQVGNDFGGCIDAGFATEVSSLIAGLAFLIFAIALLAAMFKLWWTLLKCYTLFLVYVIFGPVMIMAGVLPGSKINFENWLRHIIAYLAVFPTSIAIFLLGKTLMDLYTQNTGFMPPLIGASQQVSKFLGPLLGFAILMLAPQAAAMVQEALAAPDFKFLPQVGQGIAAGGSIVTGGFNKAIWDPLFREQNVATGQRGGLIREAIIGSANNANSNPIIRRLGRWFGYTREGAGK